MKTIQERRAEFEKDMVAMMAKHNCEMGFCRPVGVYFFSEWCETQGETEEGGQFEFSFVDETMMVK